jgi:glutathione S-transferase
MLAQPRDLVLRFNNQGVPRWEGVALRRGWPVAIGLLRRALDIRPGVEIEDEHSVWREFDFVAERLERSGPFLSGDQFGVADLTFAALSAPVILPANYGVPLPPPDALAPETARLVERARTHPAGAFALELFARHRGERPGSTSHRR